MAKTREKTRERLNLHLGGDLAGVGAALFEFCTQRGLKVGHYVARAVLERMLADGGEPYLRHALGAKTLAALMGKVPRA